MKTSHRHKVDTPLIHHHDTTSVASYPSCNSFVIGKGNYECACNHLVFVLWDVAPWPGHCLCLWHLQLTYFKTGQIMSPLLCVFPKSTVIAIMYLHRIRQWTKREHWINTKEKCSLYLFIVSCLVTTITSQPQPLHGLLINVSLKILSHPDHAIYTEAESRATGILVLPLIQKGFFMLSTSH